MFSEGMCLKAFYNATSPAFVVLLIYVISFGKKRDPLCWHGACNSKPVTDYWELLMSDKESTFVDKSQQSKVNCLAIFLAIEFSGKS